MANRGMAGPKFTPVVGEVELDFSFACNSASDPDTTAFRGAVDFVQSVTRSASARYLLTLKDSYRYCISSFASLDDTVTAGDGAYATVGAAQNEGSASAPVTFLVHTRAAGGTETQFTNARRVSVKLVLKNSTVGS